MKRNKGFTLIELLVVVAIIALLISILLPSLARARELAKRTVCMSNLKGIGNSCHIYANENFDLFPIAPHNPSNVSFIGAIGAKGSAANPQGLPSPGGDFTTADANVSTTASMWILVRDGGTSPGQFYCPSSSDEKDLTERTIAMYDFTGYNTVSYGFQIPFNARNQAKPGSGSDPRIAVAADKGPYSELGQSLGTATSGQTGFSDRQRTPQGTYPTPQDPLENHKPFNSANHGGTGDGEGQNVLYADSHAEFSKTSEAGAEGDNIYTSGPTFTGNQGGVVQNGMYPGRDGASHFGVANSPTDSLIYP